MPLPHKDPHTVLQVPPGASMSVVDNAYRAGLRMLGQDCMAAYGMFDAASTEKLRAELELAYGALKAAAAKQLQPQPQLPGAPEQAGAPSADQPRDRAGPKAQGAPAEPPQPAAEPRGTILPSPSPAAQAFDGPPKQTSAAPFVPAPATQTPVAYRQASPKRVRLCAPRTEPLEEPLTGKMLRDLREALGADVDEICELTKINRRYIVALEEEDFSLLPATVYVRGFVGEYARVLGLHVQATAPYIEAYTKWNQARL